VVSVTTPGEPRTNVDLELLAAQLRRQTEDLSLYGGMLLNVLSAALPANLVEVRREGRLKSRLAGREPAVLGISIELANLRFDLDRADFMARPVTRLGHQSGGVVMSSRVVSAEEWCAALAAALVETAGIDAGALAALQRLTEP
jgi:hypothetical protein